MAVDGSHLVLGPLLGSGGFGEVYRGTMRSPGGLEKTVAVKVLHAHADLPADAPDRLRDEARLLSSIGHPVVVQALDLLWIAGRAALVTEFVPGLDLQRCIHGERPPGPRAVLDVIAPIAAALEAAWTKSGLDGEPLHIVHRDIKPSNIRVGRHGEVRLLDFGIARFTAPDRRVNTRTDVVVGSAPYMAPERFAERAMSPAIDVFGLGCCLFEGLARVRFHQRANLRHITALAVSRERYDVHLDDRLGTLSGEIPAVIPLLRACLAHDPQARPSAADLAQASEALAEQLGGQSLKRWCSATSWPPPSQLTGSLTGVHAGGAVAPKPPPSPAHDEGGPRVIRVPQITRDPDGGAPERDTPSAPPAFPSIPSSSPLHGEAPPDVTLLGVAPTARRRRSPLSETVLLPRADTPAQGLRPELATALAASGCLLGFAGTGLMAVAIAGLAWILLA